MDESGELTEPMEEVPLIGVVDEEKQEVDSRDEGKHTARSVVRRQDDVYRRTSKCDQRCAKGVHVLLSSPK